MGNQQLDTLLSLSQLPEITLTASMAHALENMKKCRTVEKGGRVLFCPECKTSMILYNPCNKRGCPICYQKNQIQWQNKAERKLLPVTHYHLTFSIPDSYTGIWLRNKNAVMDSLFIAVREAIVVIGEDSGLLLGSLLVFQSHGRGMSYKPHMHCVLSSGGLDSEKKWAELKNIPTRKMEQITEETFEEELQKRLKSDVEVRNIKAKAKQYRIYTGIHEGSGKNIIEYLSRSRNGVVIDMEQDLIIEEESIEFKEVDGGVERRTRLDKTTFIERYLNHIPPEGAVVARYYGLYSNRHKEDLRIAKEQIGNGKEEELKPYKELCPKCKKEMIVIEIIKKHEKHLFWKYGNEQGPPGHGEIISVA
ncbi:MAG: transposase [Candidatus Cloacimonadaceae bacterium]|nr:transposase [Candidatus Cloacimonadaceae bacterium]